MRIISYVKVRCIIRLSGCCNNKMMKRCERTVFSLQRATRMKSLVILLVVQISIISGECPHPNFVQNHVCQYCTNWKQVGGGGGGRWKVCHSVASEGPGAPGGCRSPGGDCSAGTS